MKTVNISLDYSFRVDNIINKDSLSINNISANYRIESINKAWDIFSPELNNKYDDWWYNRFEVTGDNDSNFWN